MNQFMANMPQFMNQMGAAGMPNPMMMGQAPNMMPGAGQPGAANMS